jgi:hypothetical protein
MSGRALDRLLQRLRELALLAMVVGVLGLISGAPAFF